MQFLNYVEVRDPELYAELIEEGLGSSLRKVIAPLGLALGGMFGTGDAAAEPMPIADAGQLSEDDIIGMYQTTPLQVLRMGQKSPDKFEKDLAGLRAPSEDIGMAVHKGNLNKKILVAVLTDKAMSSYAPGKLGLANPDSGWILLSKKAFSKLPKGETLDGAELTEDGYETLSHEARHLTQGTDKVPLGRSQVTGGAEAYRTDPTELGVRLAALKNMLGRDYLSKLVATKFPASGMQSVMQKLIGYTDDEKELFSIIADPQSGAASIMANGAGRKLFGDIGAEKLQKAIESLALLLSAEQTDVADLLHTIKGLKGAEKKKIIDELIRNYNSVVKGRHKNASTIGNGIL